MVTQYAVYKNSREREAFPYLLVVQHRLSDHLSSRVVVPLMSRKKFGPPISRLNPVFTVEDHEMVMVTHLIGAVSAASLRTRVSDLSARRSDIVAALDMLLTGF